MTKKEKVLQMVARHGILRPRDLEAAGISGEYLNLLHSEGLLERLSRGIYVLPGAELGANRDLIETCKKIPGGVLCLLTALRYHELTTEAPSQVWVAIGEKSRVPRIAYPPLRIVRFFKTSLSYGVESDKIEGALVRVYSPAKTVADCFKYRNKIGLDVAIEALRDCWSQRKATSDQLWEAAKVCRMTNVIRPYMEVLV